MARIRYRKSPGVVASAVLIAAFTVGGVAWHEAQETAQLAVSTVEEFEGYVPEAYLDPAGIWTKCYGDTRNVRPGATYTFEQCAASLNEHLAEITRPVFRCVPALSEQHSKVQASFASMAYNIGSGAFCSSSVARYANAGNWERACRRMAEIYTTAKGQPMPGLKVRRKTESDMCLEGLHEAGLEGAR
ncbi:MAG: lysozyme [Desulfovibrio sp.]|nr:lysozyme [Desulfovibrio sp.]